MATNLDYTMTRRSYGGHESQWVKILKALVELDGHAKSADVYEKAYGHPRGGNQSNGLFAGLAKNHLIRYNPKTREIELTEEGYRRAGVDIDYPTTKDTLSRLAAAGGGSTTFDSAHRQDWAETNYGQGWPKDDSTELNNVEKSKIRSAVNQAIDSIMDDDLERKLKAVKEYAIKCITDNLFVWGLDD